MLSGATRPLLRMRTASIHWNPHWREDMKPQWIIETQALLFLSILVALRLALNIASMKSRITFGLCFADETRKFACGMCGQNFSLRIVSTFRLALPFRVLVTHTGLEPVTQRLSATIPLLAVFPLSCIHFEYTPTRSPSWLMSDDADLF